MHFMRIFNIAIFTMVAIFLVFDLSFAGIIVEPTVHKVELAQGESAEVEFKIYNDGPWDLDMTTDPKDWAKLKENENIDINSWLKIEPSSFKVKKDETVAIKCKIDVPQKATGELVAMIYLCYKENPESALNIRFGNPLYVYIKGTEKYGLEIKQVNFYKIIKQIESEKIPTLVTSVELLNTGNRDIKPDINAIFYNETKKEVCSLKLDKKAPIFGEQRYDYKIEWEYFSLPAGKYKVKIIVKYLDKTLEKILDYEVKEEDK